MLMRMVESFLRRLVVPVVCVYVATLVVTGAEWANTSPDGKQRVSVTLNERGELQYDVRRGRRVVIEESPLGLTCNDHDFAKGLSFVSATKTEKRREKYELFS